MTVQERKKLEFFTRPMACFFHNIGYADDVRCRGEKQTC